MKIGVARATLCHTLATPLVTVLCTLFNVHKALSLQSALTLHIMQLISTIEQHVY